MSALNDQVAAIFGSAVAEPVEAPYSAVPKAMRDIAHWVVWKHVTRDGKKTKPPFDAKTGRNASTTDPATWTTFDDAVKVASNFKNGWDGIGFVFTGTPFVGIDCDGVLRDEKVEPYAAAVLALLDSYTEVSPSGNGLKTIIECPNPGLSKALGYRFNLGEHTGIEVYDRTSPRYFTVTGQRFSGIEIPKIEDFALLYLLLRQYTHEKFKRLWIADATLWNKNSKSSADPLAGKYKSQSEADLGLCALLAPLLNYEYARIEAAFLASALGQRDKVKGRKDDYLRNTVVTAIGNHKPAEVASASTREPQYTKRGEAPPSLDALVFHLPAIPSTSSFDYVLAPLSGSHSNEGWFPRGGVSLVGAPSGGGKTTLMYQLLTAQVRKAKFFGHETYGKPFRILAVDRGEQAHERTMYSLRLPIDALPFKHLKLACDGAAVQEVINQIETCDPLPQVVLVEGVDYMVSHVNDGQYVSAFLDALNSVARHFNIAIIGTLGSPKVKIGHGYAAVRDNFLGSAAWGRFSETMLNLQFPQNDDTKGRRKLYVLLRHEAAERFTVEFQNGQLVLVSDNEINDEENDAVFAEIQWFKEQARLAKDDPTKEWWTLLDFQRALNIPHATAQRHVDDELTKNHIRLKAGKRVGTKAKQYCWNESKTNPLWVEQQRKEHDQHQETF